MRDLEKESNFSTNFIILLVKIVFDGETCDHWDDPGVDGRIILRWIFRKWDGGLEMTDLTG
jgi:hypothetical protein